MLPRAASSVYSVAPVPPPRPHSIGLLVLLGLCCLGLILLLVAATIVLSLIPIYTPRRGLTRTPQTVQFSVRLTNGQLLPIGVFNSAQKTILQNAIQAQLNSNPKTRGSTILVSSAIGRGSGKRKRRQTITLAEFVDVTALFTCGLNSICGAALNFLDQIIITDVIESELVDAETTIPLATTTANSTITVGANCNCGSTTGKFPDSTAFLFLDYEEGIVETIPNSPATTSFLSQSSSWLGYVRASSRNSSRIMFSNVQFRPGYPDVSCRNIQFSYVQSLGTLIEGSASTQFYTGFQPNSNEIQFVKQRFSAAYNSQLLTLLDSQCIDTVVLTGLYTSGVILSTTRQLADMDFSIYVLKDAVIDPNSTVNEVLLDSVLPVQATVLTVDTAKNML